MPPATTQLLDEARIGGSFAAYPDSTCRDRLSSGRQRRTKRTKPGRRQDPPTQDLFGEGSGSPEVSLVAEALRAGVADEVPLEAPDEALHEELDYEEALAKRQIEPGPTLIGPERC